MRTRETPPFRTRAGFSFGDCEIQTLHIVVLEIAISLIVGFALG
jgi:hypothetical protein